MLPLEYLTYGSGTANIVSKPLASGVAKEYHVADHLGSNRVTLSSSGTLLKRIDYKPFGDVMSGTPSR